MTTPPANETLEQCLDRTGAALVDAVLARATERSVADCEARLNLLRNRIDTRKEPANMPTRSTKAKATRSKKGDDATKPKRGGARPGAGRPRTILNGDSKPFALRLPGAVVDFIKGADLVDEVRELIVRFVEKRKAKAGKEPRDH